MGKTDIIAKSALFRGMPDEHLGQLAGIGIEKKFGRGQSIFFEGDAGDGFYMVKSGRVKIFKLSFAGKEQTLHIFGPGEPFGEIAVFHGTPFPASAETLEKSSVLFFPKRDFIYLVHKNPSIAMNMLGLLSIRLKRFTTQIENLSLKEVPERLLSYLLVLCDEQNNREQIKLEISKGQLASLLGTIPETLSRIFAKMSEEGLIRVEGRVIYILDREAILVRIGE